ncbi:hypothetical protein ACP179_16510 [Xenorhabdus stockiae]
MLQIAKTIVALQNVSGGAPESGLCSFNLDGNPVDVAMAMRLVPD